MEAKGLGPVEARFADIIWDKEPVTSPELVKLAEEALGWKTSITYTILRRLRRRGSGPCSSATTFPPPS